MQTKYQLKEKHVNRKKMSVSLHNAALYYAFQAILIAIWWLIIIFVPSFREWFFPSSDLRPIVIALALPDFFVLIIGSAIVSIFSIYSTGLARPVAWIVTGGALYSAFYTLGWCLSAPVPLFSPVLMMLLAVGSFYYAKKVV